MNYNWTISGNHHQPSSRLNVDTEITLNYYGIWCNRESGRPQRTFPEVFFSSDQRFMQWTKINSEFYSADVRCLRRLLEPKGIGDNFDIMPIWYGWRILPFWSPISKVPVYKRHAKITPRCKFRQSSKKCHQLWIANIKTSPT